MHGQLLVVCTSSIWIWPVVLSISYTHQVAVAAYYGHLLAFHLTDKRHKHQSISSWNMSQSSVRGRQDTLLSTFQNLLTIAQLIALLWPSSCPPLSHDTCTLMVGAHFRISLPLLNWIDILHASIYFLLCNKWLFICPVSR